MSNYEDKVTEVKAMGLLVDVDKRDWGVVLTVRKVKGGPSWTRALTNGQIASGETGQLEQILDGRIQVTADDVKVK